MSRDGLLLRFRSASGSFAWGEAAPLPGFSEETLDETQAELVEILPELLNVEMLDDLTSLDQAFERWLGATLLPPSAVFAIETAALGLQAAEESTPLAGLLIDNPPKVIPVNGLVVGNAETAARRVTDLLDDGFRAIKIKVGRQPVDKDIAFVRSLATLIAARAVLRLDANRAWSLPDAVTFVDATADLGIEYIEEPLADPDELPMLMERTPVPFALDESLRELNPTDLSGLPPFAAIVLKPTLLGGLERCAAFARAVKERETKVVISSSFESSVGIATLAQFAAAFGTPDTPHGLETLGWFERDVLSESLRLHQGCFEMDRLHRAAATVDTRFLQEVLDV